jgi:hypothetical protein
MSSFGPYGYLLFGALVVGVVCLIISEIDKHRKKPH